MPKLLSQTGMNRSRSPHKTPAVAITAAVFFLIAARVVAAPDSEPSTPIADRLDELSRAHLYPEASSIVHEVLNQDLVADLRISDAKLLHAYDVARAPFQHRDSRVREVAGAHAGKALEGASKSIMLWGPYSELPEGDYLVVYRFKVARPPEPFGTIFLDVSHNACTRAGRRLDAAKQTTGEWQEIAVPLHLPEAMKLEFRFWPGGNPTALDRLYVFRVTPDPQTQKPVEELPPGRLVPGRDDVVRSPHTDDPGMIDVSALSPGARVVCPYTSKPFRVP